MLVYSYNNIQWIVRSKNKEDERFFGPFTLKGASEFLAKTDGSLTQPVIIPLHCPEWR